MPVPGTMDWSIQRDSGFFVSWRPIVNESGCGPPGAVESHHAIVDPPDAVRGQALVLRRHRSDIGARNDAVVAVGRPLDGMARAAVLRRRRARDRRRSHLATAPGLS